MGEEILVAEQIEAGAEFVRDFNQYVPVAVAFWVASGESDDLVLYVASDDIDDRNFDVAYGEVLRRLGGKRSRWLDPFQIKLLNSSDPIARDAVRIRDRYPAPLVTRYGGSSLGGTSVDGACIYPPISTLNAVP
ncbi:MAG: hypothetical protein KDA55_23540 [Planctomycetales bacterium]|nr:hypothetical protein [Planctomycetales bacterium]